MDPLALHKAIEAAAEAGHDAFYHIDQESSDLAYVFASRQTKEQWREVALKMLEAVYGAG